MNLNEGNIAYNVAFHTVQVAALLTFYVVSNMDPGIIGMFLVSLCGARFGYLSMNKSVDVHNLWTLHFHDSLSIDEQYHIQ